MTTFDPNHPPYDVEARCERIAALREEADRIEAALPVTRADLVTVREGIGNQYDRLNRHERAIDGLLDAVWMIRLVGVGVAGALVVLMLSLTT